MNSVLEQQVDVLSRLATTIRNGLTQAELAVPPINELLAELADMGVGNFEYEGPAVVEREFGDFRLQGGIGLRDALHAVSPLRDRDGVFPDHSTAVSGSAAHRREVKHPGRIRFSKRRLASSERRKPDARPRDRLTIKHHSPFDIRHGRAGSSAATSTDDRDQPRKNKARRARTPFFHCYVSVSYRCPTAPQPAPPRQRRFSAAHWSLDNDLASPLPMVPIAPQTPHAD